jgi:ATP-dependent RNA helicase HelY
MAVNLVGSFGREPARALLESSFAQFQADKSVVGIARQIAKNLEALEGYRESMTCHLGDVEEYAELRAAVKRRETEIAKSGAVQRRAAAAQSLERLKPGDVIRVPSGRRSGLAVVIDPGVGMSGDSHPLVVTEDRWAGRLSPSDFPAAVEPIGHVKVPRNFNHRTPQARRDLASSLRALGLASGRPPRHRSQVGDDETLTRLRTELRRHPVHGCDDREQHMRWAERWQRLRADTDALERRVAGKTSSIARTFDRVCDVLSTLGYLDGEEVTETGKQLARVYSEADLLVVECLRAGVWDDLTAAELAAVVSTLVYESRRPDESVPRVPSGPVQSALAEMARVWGRLGEAEARERLSFLREPEVGFTWAAWRWASGAALEQVLDDDPDMTAGDFVRWCKQLVDLLSQIALVAAAGSPVRRTSRQAIDAVRRGVVAYSSLV